MMPFRLWIPADARKGSMMVLALVGPLKEADPASINTVPLFVRQSWQDASPTSKTTSEGLEMRGDINPKMIEPIIAVESSIQPKILNRFPTAINIIPIV